MKESFSIEESQKITCWKFSTASHIHFMYKVGC